MKKNFILNLFTLLLFIALDTKAQDPVITLNGKTISKTEMEAINPELIESVNVWKGENALKKYGEKAINGYIEIKTIQPDVDAQFPGGMIELGNFLSKTLDAKMIKSEGPITSFVQFTVEKTGTLSNFKIVKSGSPEWDEIAINAIKQSPDWKPAEKNGSAVPSIYTLPIRYMKDPMK